MSKAPTSISCGNARLGFISQISFSFVKTCMKKKYYDDKLQQKKRELHFETAA